MAALHAVAFPRARRWSASEFAGLLDRPGTAVIPHPHGFALVGITPPEAELLTLAVDPAHQRLGIGTGLLDAAITLAGRRGATRMILDVAADNAAARALYAKAGFAQLTTRRAYYRRADGDGIDAVVLALATLGPGRPGGRPETG